MPVENIIRTFRAAVKYSLISPSVIIIVIIFIYYYHLRCKNVWMPYPNKTYIGARNVAYDACLEYLVYT